MHKPPSIALLDDGLSGVLFRTADRLAVNAIGAFYPRLGMNQVKFKKVCSALIRSLGNPVAIRPSISVILQLVSLFLCSPASTSSSFVFLNCCLFSHLAWFHSQSVPCQRSIASFRKLGAVLLASVARTRPAPSFSNMLCGDRQAIESRR